jgi:hypothetical protein
VLFTFKVAYQPEPRTTAPRAKIENLSRSYTGKCIPQEWQNRLVRIAEVPECLERICDQIPQERRKAGVIVNFEEFRAALTVSIRQVNSSVPLFEDTFHVDGASGIARRVTAPP